MIGDPHPALDALLEPRHATSSPGSAPTAAPPAPSPACSSPTTGSSARPTSAWPTCTSRTACTATRSGWNWRAVVALARRRRDGDRRAPTAAPFPADGILPFLKSPFAFADYSWVVGLVVSFVLYWAFMRFVPAPVRPGHGRVGRPAGPLATVRRAHARPDISVDEAPPREGPRDISARADARARALRTLLATSARKAAHRSRSGNEAWVPGRVTLSEAQRIPSRTASSSGNPRANPTANAPTNASPAPDVSVAVTAHGREARHPPVAGHQGGAPRSERHHEPPPRPTGEPHQRRIRRVDARTGEDPELHLVRDEPVGDGEELRGDRRGRRRVQDGHRAARPRNLEPRHRGCLRDLELPDDGIEALHGRDGGRNMLGVSRGRSRRGRR